ncbi:hypothetical protein BABINDRAFT_160717 [Babjeviella inositovora NRRL Y-12698]|uniref:Uncharacterized protein n=1 Tax=Babjeviella inositovora NRRL Y-12698 TaxID=984486 RepID=A0A1E3QUK5_9ASCO|nr:uncharacterized protein BABINDRAFT_160717 [Babjeviella inositovora NRRL Y-12698]ODQ81365.1 hypothetical protein BABINDRAFT_160717 [Babjeviella inositovora NRRL Y-12698]
MSSNHPVRVALLGGTNVGKSAIISKVQNIPSNYCIYYPTRETMSVIVPCTRQSHGGFVTESLVEVIDNPGYKASFTIPFLCASTNFKMTDEEMRQYHETTRKQTGYPLLVALGFDEMNADVEAYILVYNTVPYSTNTAPPGYEDGSSESEGEPQGYGTPSPGRPPNLDTLRNIRNSLFDAWACYYDFENKRKLRVDVQSQGENGSVLKSMKHLWGKESKTAPSQGPGLTQVNSNPRLQMPPVILVANSVDHELSSPLLLRLGEDLAKEWNCPLVKMRHSKDPTPGYEDAQKILRVVLDEIDRAKFSPKKFLRAGPPICLQTGGGSLTGGIVEPAEMERSSSSRSGVPAHM